MASPKSTALGHSSIGSPAARGSPAGRRDGLSGSLGSACGAARAWLAASATSSCASALDPPRRGARVDDAGGEQLPLEADERVALLLGGEVAGVAVAGLVVRGGVRVRAGHRGVEQRGPVAGTDAGDRLGRRPSRLAK